MTHTRYAHSGYPRARCLHLRRLYLYCYLRDMILKYLPLRCMPLKHIVTLSALLWLLPISASANNPVWLIDIKGAIGPATADHMIRGLEQAQQAGARLVILQIDTPGGLDNAMRQMIKSILAANIPIAAYVAPAGARAASAGTYILYASHIAAMAPATNLGAATPVQIGSPGLPSLPDNKDQEQEPGTTPGTATERKMVNDAIAYIQGLAELRGRNEEWAAKAVLEGASLPAEKALAIDVIEIVATDIDDLLTQMDGRTITVAGSETTLSTKAVAVYQHPIDWRSEFLSVITNPNIAYMLMLVGIYGLIFEFSNPGFGLPGVLGAVCLFLAMYALQVLPVSYAGLGLMILGIGLMTAEAFAPSFGILGLGGIIAFVIGSIILMDTDLPGYQIALPVIAAVTVFSAALLIVALGLIVRARKQAVVSGLEHLVGAPAIVESIHDNAPFVRLDGELWQVQGDQALQIDDAVTVTAADGIVLHVKKQNGER